jgi:hypothetical protein
MLGIYKIEDGMLHVCWAEIDAKRPTKFATTKPGGGSFEYAIYSRTKDQELRKQTGKEPSGTGKDIRTLQVKLAEKWKDDDAFLGVRKFRKDKTELLAVLHPGKAPATPLELVQMTKKNANLFPGYVWVKTTGIGKFADGVFIIGECKAGASAGGIGAVRTVDGVSVLFIGAPANDAAARKEMLDMVKSAHFGPQGPPEIGAKNPPGKRPKLADLKFTLPKKWEAKYSDAVMWRISYDGFDPSISAYWMVESRYPKGLDDLVKKMEETDYFGNGMYLASVSEKGKLPDGLYVFGKFKMGKDAKESKYIGVAILRDFGGYNLKFESFSTSYDDAKLLKDAIAICKSAKF